MTSRQSLLFAFVVLLSSSSSLLAQQRGYLKVASYPEGAQITIDGTVFGQASSSLETARVLPLQAGPHNLYVFIEGLDDFFDVVNIVTGDTIEVFVPLAEPQGFLTVKTEPADAEVAIDDSTIGFTPLSRIPLPVKRLAVSVEKKCFLPEQRSVELLPGKETEVDLKLRQQIKLAAISAAEVQRVELCQSGNIVSATYVLAGQLGDRFDVYPVLRRETGEMLSMPIDGSVGAKLAPGPDKRIIISIAPNVPEFEVVELSFNVVPSKKGGSKVIYFALGALAAAGGAAAILLGGGGGTTTTPPPTTTIANPPSPPN